MNTRFLSPVVPEVFYRITEGNSKPTLLSPGFKSLIPDQKILGDDELSDQKILRDDGTVGQKTSEVTILPDRKSSGDDGTVGRKTSEVTVCLGFLAQHLG